MRVLLDTNVLAAAYGTRGLCADVLRVVLTRHELVIGAVILDELREVITRKFKLPQGSWEAVESALLRVPLIQHPTPRHLLGLDDVDDELIYATAVDGHADVIVTCDKAFIEQGSGSSIPIISPRQFWEMLRDISER